MVCGNLCPAGSAFIMDAIFRMPDGTSYSCEQADVAVQYTLDSQMCAEFKSAAFSVCCNITNNNGTVWDILVNNSDSSLFSQALESVNVDKLLDDYYGTFTVFAPNDNAFESEERLGIYSNNLFAWREHLTNALLNHIVSGLALTFADLVAIVDDGADFRLTTLANEILIVDEDTKITVSGGLFRFSNRTIASAEIVSSNGVVHVINDFLATTWYEQTIADILEAATILDWGLSVLYGLLSQASLLEDDALTEISLNGTTLLAPSDDAYQLEADGPGADDTELLYLVVESNIHPDDLQNGTSLALSTRHPTAEIWLSVNETGALRYNGASLEEVIFANNG